MPVSPQTDLDRILPGSRGPAPQSRHRAPAKVPYEPKPSMQPKESAVVEGASSDGRAEVVESTEAHESTEAPEPTDSVPVANSSADSEAPHSSSMPPPPQPVTDTPDGSAGLAGMGAKAAARLKSSGAGPAAVVGAAGAGLTGMGARAASRIAPGIAGAPDETEAETSGDATEDVAGEAALLDGETSEVPSTRDRSTSDKTTPAPRSTPERPPRTAKETDDTDEDDSLFAGFGKGAALVTVLVLAYFALTAWQVNSAAGDAAAVESADAIVVLGAAQYDGEPSPVFEGRLQRALDLWNDGLADVIVTTGSNQAGDRFTEGFAGYEWLLERGVPDDKVKIDVSGGSTWEQLSSARTILADRDMSSAILVSDPYHRFRLEQIAGEVGLDAVVAATEHDPSFGELSREVGAVSAGRVIGYRRLNNILNPEPDPVAEDEPAEEEAPADESDQ